MKKAFFLIILIILHHFSFSDTKEGIITYCIAYTGLKLRQKPSIESNCITTIPFQDIVFLLERIDVENTINGITSNWYKVNYKSNIGYVFGGYLSYTSIENIDNKDCLLLNEYFQSIKNKYCYYNRKVTFGLSEANTISILSKPTRIYSWTGSKRLEYSDTFEVMISSEHSNNPNVVMGFEYILHNMKINYSEIQKVFGEPKNIFYDEHDSVWAVYYLLDTTNIYFQTQDINDNFSRVYFYIK